MILLFQISILVRLYLVTKGQTRPENFKVSFNGLAQNLTWNALAPHISNYYISSKDRYDRWHTDQFINKPGVNSYIVPYSAVGGNYSYKMWTTKRKRYAETSISIPPINPGIPFSDVIEPKYIKINWAPSPSFSEFYVVNYIIHKTKVGSYSSQTIVVDNVTSYVDKEIDACGEIDYTILAKYNTGKVKDGLGNRFSISNLTKPRYFTVVNSEGRGIELSWKDPLFNNPHDEYEIQIFDWVPVKVQEWNIKEHTFDADLAPLTPYIFRVKSDYQCQASHSDWAVSSSIMTIRRPMEPRDSRASINNDTSITFTWTGPEEDEDDYYLSLPSLIGYFVEKLEGGTSQWQREPTMLPRFNNSFVFRNLKINYPYTFRVASVCSGVLSNWEVLNYYVFLGKPLKPINLNKIYGDIKYLTWNHQHRNYVSGFKIQQFSNDSNSWQDYCIVGNGVTNISLSTVARKYRVAASWKGIFSEWLTTQH